MKQGWEEENIVEVLSECCFFAVPTGRKISKVVVC